MSEESKNAQNRLLIHLGNDLSQNVSERVYDQDNTLKTDSSMETDSNQVQR